MKVIGKDFDEKAPGVPLIRELHPKASIPTDSQGAVIDFRSSDETLDRYNEVIIASGWKLDNYLKNPVVQNAHRYENILDTIGKSLITAVRGDHLFQRIQFAVGENPIAKITYDLYKGGFLSAVSVGFIPRRWENGSQEAGYRRKFVEQELLEVSAVGIPANPNALKLAFEAGAVSKSDLKEMLAILKNFCADEETENAGSKSNAAPGFGTNGAKRFEQLAQMTREAAAILRRV
jgi:HK97 family phage prohead protease